MPGFIQDRLPDIQAACQQYRVKNLWLYGSAATTLYEPGASDIDFMVEFTPAASDLYDGPWDKTNWPFGFPDNLEGKSLSGNYRGLQASLRNIFKDYLTKTPRKEPIDIGHYDEIMNDHIKIY